VCLLVISMFINIFFLIKKMIIIHIYIEIYKLGFLKYWYSSYNYILEKKKKKKKKYIYIYIYPKIIENIYIYNIYYIK